MIKENTPPFLGNLSIGLKIVLGFSLIFIIFLFRSILFNQFLEQNTVSQKKLIALVDSSIVVIDINRQISELQRLTLVFGQTGSESIFQRMKETHNDILQKLLIIQNQNKSNDVQSLISEMINIINNYSQNIENLKSKYIKKDNFLNNLLPFNSQEGLDLLKKFANSLRSQKNNNAFIISQEMIQLWLEMELNAIFFIKERDYEFKEQFTNKNKSLYNYLNSQNFNKIPPDSNEILTKFKKNAKEFQMIFDKAVQANRIYLTLVNVVLAGEATEFLLLSEELRKFHLNDTNLITERIKFNTEKSKRLLNLILLLSIPFLLLVAVFFKLTISNGIKGVTKSFEDLLQGDFSVIVPGIHRKDEIGTLAKAATAFKDLSIQIDKEKLKAEKLAKSKSEFLANMSHEIRTPMNGMIGMVSLLNKTELSMQQKDMLSTVESCGKNLLTIVNDVLNFSKIDSGNIKIENIDFNLKKNIEEIEFLFSSIAEEKKIDFSCVVNNDNAAFNFLIGDITRIKQILGNLISNALKFTNKGHVKLVVNSKKLDNEKIRLWFKVSDTGIGIDNKAQQDIFQAFTQADASITRKFGGTGLGLSISNELAKLMNGILMFSSMKNQGSCFTLSLDLNISIKTLQTSDNIEVSQPLIDNNQILKILLVEDNLVNQKVTRMMLEKIGQNCVIAENGQVAIELVENNSYDIIFMDMQMPVMDGISATKIIRKLPNGSSPKIVAMTANAFLEDQKKCFDAGMDDFLAKPVTVEHLQNILNAYLASTKKIAS